MSFSKKGKAYLEFRKKFYLSGAQQSFHKLLGIEYKKEDIEEERKKLDKSLQQKTDYL